MRRTITQEIAIALGRSLTGFYGTIVVSKVLLLLLIFHLHLLDDEVEIVPPCVGEEPWEKEEIE